VSTISRIEPRDLTLKPLDDGGLEIRFHVGDGKPLTPANLHINYPGPTAIRFLTPLKNFEQRVQVFGVDESGGEHPLVPEALLFDYSQYMDVSRTEIPLPSHDHRKYRVVVKKVSSDQESKLKELTKNFRDGKEDERQEKTTVERRPFRINAIQLIARSSETVNEADILRSYPIEKFEAVEDKERKETVITVVTHREPLVEFQLQTSSRNFNRQVRVEVPEGRNGNITWNRIASGTIANLEFGDLRRSELKIPLREQRHREYRIVIENRDSPPIEITGVEAKGPSYQIAMFALPKVGYTLHYGLENAKRPDYDIAALQAALTQVAFKRAKLGPPVAVPDDRKPLDARGALNNPVLLGALLFALVGALGWSLYHASRRIDQLPPDGT
jgi:hypothetical protein